MSAKIYAWELKKDEEVGCYFCMQEGKHKTYKRGEAYLVGSDHTPYDGNANYVCEQHLQRNAVKHDATKEK